MLRLDFHLSLCLEANLGDVPDWLKNLADNVNHEDAKRSEKRERASLLRRIAASDGPQLWKELVDRLAAHVKEFNARVQAKHDREIYGPVEESGGWIALTTRFRRLEMTASFNAEGNSILRWQSGSREEASSKDSHTVYFTIDDDDRLSFASKYHGELSPLSVDDVAKMIIEELVSPPRR